MVFSGGLRVCLFWGEMRQNAPKRRVKFEFCLKNFIEIRIFFLFQPVFLRSKHKLIVVSLLGYMSERVLDYIICEQSCICGIIWNECLWSSGAYEGVIRLTSIIGCGPISFDCGILLLLLAVLVLSLWSVIIRALDHGEIFQLCDLSIPHD